MSEPTGPLLLQASFQDFDDFVETVRDWDVEFVQVDRGQSRLDVLQAAGSGSQLGHFRFNRIFEQRGAPPRSFRTFGLLGFECSPVTWRHRTAPRNGVLGLPPGGELDAVSRPGFEGFTLSFSENLLAEVAEVLGVPTIEDLPGDGEIFHCDPEAVSGFRRWLFGFCSEIRTDRLASRERQEWLLRALEVEFPRRFVSMLSSSLPAPDAPSSPLRQHAMKRVRDIVEERPDEALTVNEICRDAGVSERTLRYAFIDHYGVPPKTYLRSLRLNSARRQLAASDPRSTGVIDVANRWGFWHMSQFAADYRRLFGELPSQTLGKCRERVQGVDLSRKNG